LIEDRPYRRAYEYKKALEILKEEAEKGKLDGKFVKELEAVVKNEPSLQKASFENVLKDIFEENYEALIHEIPEILNRELPSLLIASNHT
jgi:HD-GYP domain-containing protein (c-di-GMP phosphodiesterase class II)